MKTRGWIQAPNNGKRHYINGTWSLCHQIIAGRAAVLIDTAPDDGWNCPTCVELRGGRS